MPLPSFSDVQQAHTRIKDYIHPTPIVSSSLLNKWLGHHIYFKMESLQKIGAFKLRGALNTVLKLKEQNNLPQKIVANSSGNHAQAIAYAGALLNIPTTIYTTKSVSKVKAAATEFYGAELAMFDTRVEADQAVQQAAQQAGVLWIPPFNHPDIIAGQGTAAYEAINELVSVDAVFAPCGGGGLASGTLLATRGLFPQAKVIGVEPLAANDAADSLRANEIVSLPAPAVTLADGAATPAVGDITFELLKQLDEFYEVDEDKIAYWSQWLQHLLKMHIEPTSAMTMDAVTRWLAGQESPQKVLVIISGGNIDQAKMAQIWAQDHLSQIPSV